MSNKEYEEIIAAVKSDDISLFSSLVQQKKGYLSLCCGRFPLLSLCYLYKSKKILKEYEWQLSLVTNYVFIEEDYAAYKKFRALAGKCLRLYVFSDSLVSSLEMLAVMGESSYLAEVYRHFPKDEKITANLQRIYKILHNRDIGQDGEIAAKRRDFPKRNKVVVFTAIVTAAIILIASAFSLGYAGKLFGEGSAENPVKIYGEAQLAEVIARGGENYILQKDITLSSEWQAKDFKGNLDGNGHTINATALKGGFISALSGDLKNINFVLDGINRQLSDSASLIVKVNNGVMSNIGVRVRGEFTDTAQEKNIYLSCLAYENNGTISNSGVDADITFTGDGSGDTFFSAVACANNGVIEGCHTLASSKITTDTADAAGLVAENGQRGTVKDCVNNAGIYQSSANENWLPNAAGIVLLNFGKVEKCINNGAVTAVSESEGTPLDVYVGGIVCNNNGQIIKCKNTGDITGVSGSFNIYAGGVASNSINAAQIDNSCSYGKITVKTGKDSVSYLFAGGIAGYNSGKIKDCFSVSSFEAENGNAFLGGAAGVISYFSSTPENNFFIEQSNVIIGFAAVLFSNTLYEGTDTGTTKLADIEALQEKEVYWE